MHFFFGAVCDVMNEIYRLSYSIFYVDFASICDVQISVSACLFILFPFLSIYTLTICFCLHCSHEADKQRQSQELARCQASITTLTTQLQQARAEAARVLQHGEQARAQAEAEADKMRADLIAQLRAATGQKERLGEKTMELEGELAKQKAALGKYKKQMKKLVTWSWW